MKTNNKHNKHNKLWVQRYKTFTRAMRHLDDAVELSLKRPLSVLEKQGVVHNFKVAVELSWKVMRDYLVEQGETVGNPKDSVKKAAEKGLVDDVVHWQKIVAARNDTTYPFDVVGLDNFCTLVIEQYHPAFVSLRARFAKWAD